MKRFAKKQWVLLGLAAVVAGMAAFGAYAYWTASGTGQGTASVGTDNGVTIVVTNMGAALYPGGSATVTFHVQNDSTSSSGHGGQGRAGRPVTGLTGGCLGCRLLVRRRDAQRVRRGLR